MSHATLGKAGGRTSAGIPQLPQHPRWAWNHTCLAEAVHRGPESAEWLWDANPALALMLSSLTCPHPKDGELKAHCTSLPFDQRQLGCSSEAVTLWPQERTKKC